VLECDLRYEIDLGTGDLAAAARRFEMPRPWHGGLMTVIY